MSVIRTAVVGALLIASSACSGTRAEPRVGPERSGLQIQVDNGSTADLRIYARIGSGNSEFPIGRISGMQQRSFRLPDGVSGSIRLVARSTAARGRVGTSHVSDPFSLATGQRMTWRLRDSPGASAAPRLSTIIIFSCEEPDC